jgi:hypothetical protein
VDAVSGAVALLQQYGGGKLGTAKNPFYGK